MDQVGLHNFIESMDQMVLHTDCLKDQMVLHGLSAEDGFESTREIKGIAPQRIAPQRLVEEDQPNL
jgi:hypothetical protein